MEPLFINKSLYTKQNLTEFYKAFSRKGLALFTICLGLVILICGILIAQYSFCIIGALLCVISPIYSIWATRHIVSSSYQRMQQLYHSESETVTRFFEDHLVIHNTRDNSDITLAYPQIAKIVETKNLYYLMLSSKIGYLFEKQGFEGTTADDFGRFIRARAVGEGRTDLKKKTRKTTFSTLGVFFALVAIGIAIGFLGDKIQNTIPKTYSDGAYSIKLTSAFDEYDGEWSNGDATVYYFSDSEEDFSGDVPAFDTAASYLEYINENYDIESDITAVTDSIAWTEFTDSYEGDEYYNYDYVIKANGHYWFTEFYCLAEDAEKYTPLFEKWAQTITIDISNSKGTAQEMSGSLKTYLGIMKTYAWQMHIKRMTDIFHLAYDQNGLSHGNFTMLLLFSVNNL